MIILTQQSGKNIIDIYILNLVNDCFPVPPTPTNKALPLSC